MNAPSFYRRPLPDSQVPFAGSEGRRLFREALEAGTMEGYFVQAEQFHTQQEPAFCGLATLVVALNALAIDPGRHWKGPWRWYGEELLDCCAPLESVKNEGITFDQFACLARCNGATAKPTRASGASLEEFRAAIVSAASAPGDEILAMSYSRRVLGQTGDGHFSTIAGFHRERDLALVLDVARFKYPPHWAPVSLLFEAMLPLDAATGRSRGFIELRRGPSDIDTSACETRRLQ
ncbi:MAG: phytochelatin synthase family protein [Polyangiales bacterium]